VSELTWQDRFTGALYRCADDWLGAVRAHLAGQLEQRLAASQGVPAMAWRAARFWSVEYYRCLFPLRFGRSQEGGLLSAPNALEAQAEVQLGSRPETRFRRRLLDGTALPPILPDPELGDQGWLLADRLLAEAAFCNLLFPADVSADVRHAVRLAALTYPFADLLPQSLRAGLTGSALAAWQGRPAEAAGLPPSATDLIAAVHGRRLDGRRLDLVVVAVQRIKAYVFESQGLNEIRGASTLLDNVTDDLRSEIDEEIGPEVVLRAAGSTLLFMAPLGQGTAWVPRLRRAYYERTRVAFPAAAAVSIAAGDLLTGYGDTVSCLYRELAVDRAQAQVPLSATLPFETRCELCATRPAEFWDEAPGGEPRAVCLPCFLKRDTGRKERRGKVFQVLEDLGMPPDPTALGVRASGPEQPEPGPAAGPDVPGHVAASGEQGGQPGKQRPPVPWLADDLDGLIPGDDARRAMIGVVYGDGNNFGAVSKDIPDLPLGLQWSARVECTARAAAALALGQATQAQVRFLGARGAGAASLPHLPFQVLALGGDDLSLFAWAPVAVRFAAEFVRLTDLELAPTSEKRLNPGVRLAFSLGLLAADSKTPVRKSVDFTEKELLNWAKHAAKGQGAHGGTIALLYARGAEGVPDDLDRYRAQTYLLGRANGEQLCATLRPYAATELAMLLEVGEGIVSSGDMGRLQRLASAFYGARQGIFAGMLYYAYQRGRAERAGDDWIAGLEQSISTAAGLPAEPVLLVNYPAGGRLLFGIQDATGAPKHRTRYSPLWDLVELAKLLS
jgi:hypothetical protein